MQKSPIFAALVLLFAIPAQADFVGFKIEANYWAPDLSGGFNSDGGSSINLSSDLDISAPSTSSLGFSLEHPVPILPNFKYQSFDLDSNGRNTLNSSITFEGQTYNAADTVSSTFDLSHDDIVLYYEILDNWINLDIGLDLKRFDGEVSLVGSANTTTSRVKVDETLPLFYLSARFDLPFSGFYVGTDVSSFSINDSSADDVTIMLGYESDRGLGIEGGLRTFSLELDDVNNLDANIEYDGAFLSGYYHF